MQPTLPKLFDLENIRVHALIHLQGYRHPPHQPPNQSAN
jgi:ssRNA-specific RNase YbeY (16S rRNA maturation enzyme)